MNYGFRPTPAASAGVESRVKRLEGKLVEDGRSAAVRTGKGGTATIGSATTSVVVTHGYGATPTPGMIHITPTNSPTNDPGNMWVSAISATQFTVNCRNDPGASGLTFGWAVDPL